MSAFNGLSLVLVIALLVLAFLYWDNRQAMKNARDHRDFDLLASRISHENSAYQILAERRYGCYPHVTQTSQPREVYDWEREGL